MKLLYIAFVDFQDISFGPAKKVLSACEALEDNGYDVTLIGRKANYTVAFTQNNEKTIETHKNFNIGKIQTLIDKKYQIEGIINYIKKKNFDICYIRYDLGTYDFLKLIKTLNKATKKIVIEIATYPYDMEYSGLTGYLRLIYDKLIAKCLKHYVSRVVSFYHIPNDIFYGIPVVYIPNGFDFKKVKLASKDKPEIDINIVAVSMMRIWHAYERIIRGMRDYYNSPNINRIVYLHLVGKGPEESKYRRLVNEYSLDKYVIFHGSKSGAELDSIIEKCDIGLDSLGRHRTGISVLSSLKSREYGSRGLPIINSCEIDIINSDFDYFLHVPPDESNININDIIEFFDNIYTKEDKKTVARNIRMYFEMKCDMKQVMKKALDKIFD